MTWLKAIYSSSLRGFVGVILFLAMAGPVCHDPKEPRMGVLPADTDLSSLGDADVQCASLDFREALPFVVLHQLPPGAVAPSPVTVEVKTPCGTLSHEVSYQEFAQGTSHPLRAIDPWIAPSGAACGITITTKVAQNHLQCSYAVTDKEVCAAEAARCQARDGGTGGQSDSGSHGDSGS